MNNFNFSPNIESTLNTIALRLDLIDDSLNRLGNALERISDILDEQNSERH